MRMWSSGSGNFRDSENIVKLLEIVFGKGLGMGFGVSDDKR
jgi:hypothetical protein